MLPYATGVVLAATAIALEPMLLSVASMLVKGQESGQASDLTLEL